MDSLLNRATTWLQAQVSPPPSPSNAKPRSGATVAKVTAQQSNDDELMITSPVSYVEADDDFDLDDISEGSDEEKKDKAPQRRPLPAAARRVDAPGDVGVLRGRAATHQTAAARPMFQRGQFSTPQQSPSRHRRQQKANGARPPVSSSKFSPQQLFQKKHGRAASVDVVSSHSTGPAAGINHLNTSGYTLLMFAAMQGQTVMLKKLLKTEDIDANVKSGTEGQTALILAAHHGHADAVTTLKKHSNTDVNVEDQRGRTALMIGSLNGHTKVVHELLKFRDVDINRRDEDGATALYLAAKRRRLKVVTELLKKNCDPNIPEKKRGNTALMRAAHSGYDEVVVEMLRWSDMDPDVRNVTGLSALMMAVQKKRFDVVAALMRCKRVEPNLKQIDGATALHFAAEKGFTKILQEIVSHPRVDVNSADAQGVTPLALACQNGHEEIVKLLRSNRIRINKQTEHGMTPLMLAAQNGRLKVLKRLLTFRDINVNLTTWNHKTALMFAASGGFTEIVQELLIVDATNANAQDHVGRTALMMAASAGHRKTVFEMMAFGTPKVDVNIRAKDGSTAFTEALVQGQLHILPLLKFGFNTELLQEAYTTALKRACDDGNYKVVEHVLETQGSNIDVNRCNRHKVTPLMSAAYMGHTNVVRALLAHPAIDVNLQDDCGATALLRCIYAQSEPIAELLLRHRTPVKINISDRQGITPLMLAARKGALGILEKIITCCSRTLDPNLQDKYGRTALMFACADGNSKAVRALVRLKNVDINARDVEGWTALITASKDGHFRAVDELLMHEKIDLDIKASGRSALAYAIAADHNEVVDALQRVKRADPQFVRDARRSASVVKTELLDAVRALHGDDQAKGQLGAGLPPPPQAPPLVPNKPPPKPAAPAASAFSAPLNIVASLFKFGYGSIQSTVQTTMSVLYGSSTGNEADDLDVFSDNEEPDGGDYSDNDERNALLADA